MLGYFTWQAERGVRGFSYNQSLVSQVEKLTADLDTASSKHKILEERVAELRPNSVDPDLLDEMARKTLNYGQPNEVIVHFQN